MLTLKRMTSFVLAASLLAAPAAFAAGKAGKGKADIPAAQSFTFTAHAGEKSSLVGPGSASLELPLKPGGYLDTASPDVIKDLGLISFRTNEPAFTKVKLHMLAPPRMERVGDPTRALDCFTMLTALASVTKTIRLVSLVSCIYYHSPAMIARYSDASALLPVTSAI